MSANIFTIHISLYNGHTYSIPICRNFLPKFVDSTGYINNEGITFLTNEFYFLNQIRSAMIRCNDFKTLFMLFSHKSSFRDSISFQSQISMRPMNICSRIINHEHIGLNNFLTSEGIELVFGSQQHKNVWIHIQNYSVVFTEYYAYCVSQVLPPPVKQPGFGFGYTFGASNINTPVGFFNLSLPVPTPTFVSPFRNSSIEETNDREVINVESDNDKMYTRNIFGTKMTSVSTSVPRTPEKKHKSDEELVCPDAPKKVRK